MPARSTGGDALSRTLRELRLTAGPSQVETATRAGWSQALIARFETGRQVPTTKQVETLCDIYAVSGAPRRQVVEMAADAKAGTQRVVMYGGTALPQKRITRLADQAEQERTFSPGIVPNLLQTPTYTRAMGLADPNFTPELAAANSAEITRGQAVLDTDREYGFLLPEGALGWALLPPEGMAEQVDHLAAAMARPNVEIRIIPWGRPASALPMSAFAIFDDRLVIVGTNTRTAWLTARPEVDSYGRLYEHIASFTVGEDETRAILAELAERYRALG
ncbi:MAG: helix-turn-helix domain protein [Streptosporangiaceae bacterium]|nr:helix-turn-helix domain protein [Streptosporangiaceae bacterium]